MSRKKVSAVSLYLKELKQQPDGKFYNMSMAAVKFRSLSVQEKDYFEVSAKRLNEANNVNTEVVFTTQRDTLGNNLREITDIDTRRAAWERETLKTIIQIGLSKDVLSKEFVTVKISGVDYCRSEDNQRIFASSEICFIRFSFMKGIIDTLVLFPDIINVAAGYRQHLYEDLEENVGWKPETFRNNHSIKETIVNIRSFFNGKYEPIYVPTKDHQEEVALALETLYDELDMQCPWIDSCRDWGKGCSIYQLEHLITAILKRHPENSQEDFNVSVVLDFWRKVNTEIAPDSCERHMQYGLANQCATNLLMKYLYSTFLLEDSDELPSIQSRVGQDFFRELDFIIPQETAENQMNANVPKTPNSNWNNYFFDKSSIEDVITSLSGIKINESDSASYYKKQVEWGRGRGLGKRQDNFPSAPGVECTKRKLKLPRVIC